MRKIIFIIFFINLLLGDVQPVCGVFSNVLQTRLPDSEIDADGSGCIKNSPSCILNTPKIEQSQNGGNALHCGDGLAKASGRTGRSLSINYDFNTETVDIDDDPADTDKDVNVHYNDWPDYECKNTNLNESEYDEITQDWMGCDFELNYDGDKKINKFNEVFHTITIKNLDNHNLQIGQFITKEYDDTNLILEGIPKKIEINKINVNGSNRFTTTLEAKEKININEFNLKSSVENNVIIKSPTVVIKKLDMENDNNRVTIYADKIYIDEIVFGQVNRLEIHPYTSNNKVEFYSKKINFSSNFQMIVDSGDYHIKEFNLNNDGGSGDNISILNASDPNQVVNVYFVDGFNLGSNVGINSKGANKDFGDNPPANFRIFVNGDFTTSSGGSGENSFTTINALIYVEDDVELGSHTYVRGAISSNGDIKIGDGSKFYWDSSIDDSGFGKCSEFFQNNYACGIFPSALTSYTSIEGKNNTVYHSCTISVKNYNFNADKNFRCVDENDNPCECSGDNCFNNCKIIDAPKNKLNYTVYETDKNDDNTIKDNFFKFDEVKYGNYDLQTNRVYFEPSVTYEDNDRKIMLLGDVVFDKNNQKIFMLEGDYYFKSLNIKKNNIKICADGNVRIFVKNDFTISGNNFSGDPSCNGKVFVYTEGNAVLLGNGGGNNNIPIILYAKGDVTINNNSNAAQWFGAITAEGKIQINGNNFNFTYDKNAADSFGYGECQLCYALNNGGNWINFFNFFNMNFNFPRTMGIINNSGEELKNLNVSQIETNPSWFSMGSPEHYRVVDENKKTYRTRISNTITYTAKIPIIGKVSVSQTKSSNTGEITRWAPSVNILKLFYTELNTTADFGNYESGGYDDYLAIETYNIDANFIGSENLKYFASYYDSQGRRYSNVELSYCDIPENNNNSYKTGPFDAWDTDHNISDRNITTKIVGKEFNLTIASINKDNNATEKKTGIVVKYALVSNEDNLEISGWRDFNATNKETEMATYTITKAYKNVSVMFKVCANYDGEKYILKPYNACNNVECVPNNKVNEVCLRKFKSSDNFAIRPYGFRVFGLNQYKRAGEEFNLTIKAVDEANFNKSSGRVSDVTGVSDYNESVGNINITSAFYVPTDDETRQMNIDVYNINDTNRSRVANCPHPGTFTIVNNTDRFNNGEVNATIKFSETGVLTLNVSEINGSEFAIVDADDTNDSQRLIRAATKIFNQEDISKENLLMFIPYKFVTTAEYNTTKNSNWVYMSNDVKKSNTTYTTPKMAAFIKYTIKAYNKDNNPVNNYTGTCFPDIDKSHAPKVNGLKLNTTFDLFLDAKLSSSKDVNISLYTEDRYSNAIWTLNTNKTLNTGINSIQEWISPLNFENGEGIAKVYFNIDKNYSVPMSEVNITVIDANTSTSWMSNSGATNVFIGNLLNDTVTFRYGRIHLQNITVYDSNEANATIEYLYWTNSGWKVNTEHNQTSYGDINEAAVNSLLSTLNIPVNVNIVKQSGKNILNGKENIKIMTTHGLPYSAKIHFDIDSWLWYHPLAKPYNPPSTSNLDCLTHPCMKVTFQKTGSGWAGIGRKNSKYNENNKTVKTNLKKEINATKNEVKKLNW